MKEKPSKANRNIISQSITFLFILSFLMVSGCDKGPADDDNWENQQNISVVQTDWVSDDAQDTEIEDTIDDELVEQLEEPISESVEFEDDDQIQLTDILPYSVQVGAFLNPKYADNLVEDLRKRGYDPVIVQAVPPAKQWNFVRIGNYEDKLSAVEAANAFAEIENMETAVVKNETIVKLAKPGKSETSMDNSVEPAPIMPEITEELGETTDGDFAFQVGGLRTKENAENFKTVLIKRGYKPYIAEITSAYGSDIWFTIRIGHFSDIDRAADAADAFMNRENIPAQAIAIDE